ncbi:hypothetical protein MPTK1_4g10290 [Marchantia polymorpha subsp. ruderalis]|uniref:Uncharacterized protein n=2 Tax=Marchantia polymorpha TaxID=3197 RepID=A0AAF6B8E7_MARPO|nr:hypothetical protein MARPO_0011s0016 [Marchantia polymorpha]BBN08281.1 hypothetical protein Mp_4g10290 [Marchantia polymorpha subsp. ruderalis]|eukprot:PTQ46317.1 hypothetical protein MARPO_0011s0016 [Marchantia polymorpha]
MYAAAKRRVEMARVDGTAIYTRQMASPAQPPLLPQIIDRHLLPACLPALPPSKASCSRSLRFICRGDVTFLRAGPIRTSRYAPAEKWFPALLHCFHTCSSSSSGSSL